MNENKPNPSKRVQRSQIKRITREAIVLRWMRRSRRMSMRAAGALIGVTGSAVSHYEQGRMDLPKARVPQLIAGYHYTPAEYDEYVLGKTLPCLDLRDECEQIVQRMEAAKLKTLHAVLVSFM